MSSRYSKEEKILLELIKNIELPDDYSETVLDEIEGPDAKTVEHIRKKTHKKLGNSKIRKFSTRFLWWVAAAVLLVVMTVTALIGPERVIAGIEEVLKLVPGFGLQKEEDVQVALEEELTLELDYMDLTIVGLNSDGERTTLELQIENLEEEYYLREDFFDRELMREETDEVCPLMGPRPTEKPRPFEERWPKLVDNQGNSIRANRWSPDYLVVSGQTIPQGGKFGFAPLEPGTTRVTLVLPDPREKGETVFIEIPLAEEGDLREISIPGEPSENLHGVTLSASAKACEDETQVTLAVKPENDPWHVYNIYNIKGMFAREKLVVS